MTAFTEPQLPFDNDDLRDHLAVLIRDHGYIKVMDQLRLMMPTIIAASAPARWTDPDTSHAAAKRSQDVGRFSSRARSAKLLAVLATGDYTDQEATTRVVGRSVPPSVFEGCRRRMSDLRAVNYIIDSGARRNNAGSEEDSIVWTITDAGRGALSWLDATGWSR